MAELDARQDVSADSLIAAHLIWCRADPPAKTSKSRTLRVGHYQFETLHPFNDGTVVSAV